MCFSVSWPSENDIKQLKEDDLSEREYFGDAETSSSDSEKERCDYEDQFETRFSKGKSFPLVSIQEKTFRLFHTADTTVVNIYMLFAGWEVRMVKNCDRGHSFSPYGPTLSRQMTCLFFPAVNWFCSRLQMDLFT